MGLTRIRAEQISDIDYKQAVRVISTTNVTLSGGAPSTVDGVTLNTNDRILVSGQGTGSQNGLYFVAVLGSGSNGTWTRSADSNTTGEINAGMIVMVTEGNEYADTSWKLVTDDPIVIGTTSLEFLQNTGNSFSIINVVGSSNVVANGVSSQVSFVSGNNISITGNNAADIITFNVVQSPSFTGNVTANYYYGNGAYLTGISASNIIGAYSNANVANYLPTFSGDLGNVGNITASGNIVAGNVSAVGNISATYFIGDGSQLTGVEAKNANANSLIGNTLSSNVVNSSLTTVGTLANLSVAGTTQSGNLLTGGLVSATGNITGNYIIGNGSQLSSITGANVTGTVANATYAVSAGSAVGTAATVTTNAQPNITSVGLLTSLSATGDISTAGNITGNYIIGNGSQLTSITGANVTGTVANATYAVSAGSAVGTAATVTTNAQPNITSVGTLTSLTVTGNTQSGNLLTGGYLSATGNVTGNNFLMYGDGNILGNLNVQGNITFIDSNVIVTNDLYVALANNQSTYANINGAGLTAGNTGTGALTNWTYNTLANAWTTNVGISATANISGGNILTVGLISSTGNIYGGNLSVGNGNLTGGNLSVTGLVSGFINVGNISVSGNVAVNSLISNTFISASGNVYGNYVYGNGINLTGLANVTFGTTPPSNATAIVGDIWIDSNSGIQYIYFNDVAGYIWAEMEAQTSFSSTGYANLTTGTTNTQVLYNASNAIVGSNNLTFDGTTLSAQGVTVGSALQISANSIISNTNNSNLTINTTGSASYVILTGGMSVFSYGGNKLIQSVGDTVNFYTPLLNSVDGAVDIIGSVDGNSLSPQNTGVMLHISGQPTLPSRIYNDGANSYSAYIGRMYNGNASAPTAVLANTVVTRFGATPYGNAGWPSISTTRIDMVTTENQTTTNAGSKMTFWATPTGSNTVTQIMSLDNANLSITGNIITSGAITSGGYSGNLVPTVDNAYILGNATNRWANLWLGPGTLYITDAANNANTTQLTVFNGVLQVNGATGLQANLISGNSTLTMANSGNINMSIAGTANVLKVANTGTYTTGLISATGNIYGNNLSLAGNIYGNVNANINGTISTTGNVYIAGNLSVGGTVNFVPATYGTFANTSNITAATNSTPAVILWNTAIANSGVTYSAGNSRITVTKTGTYNFTYTAMFNGNGGSPTGYVWLRLNGTDVANSMATGATTGTVQVVISGGAPISITANQYVEVVWAVDNKTNGTLTSSAANSAGFTHPASPSVTLTVMPTGV